MKNKVHFILIAIIALGFLLRIYNINWDSGFHMHPDERAIVLATTAMQFPASWHIFTSPLSPWNPHFFAYGSLPMYLLWILGKAFGVINPLFDTYDKINLVGRGVSAIADTTTILLIYFLGKAISNQKVGVCAALMYALSVLPIQLAHFYAVDSLLTCFITAVLLFSVLFYTNPSKKLGFLLGLFFGLALATKVSATVLLVSIVLTLSMDFLLVFLKQPHRPHTWLPHIPLFLKRLVTEGIILLVTALITYALCEPYAFLSFTEFKTQTLQQSAMTKNAFVFPYTLQYVEKIPYIYELKNVFLFGLGPVIALLTLVGVFSMTSDILRREKEGKWAKELVFLTFGLLYFGVVGHFAIGFIRYMLPLYPLFALWAGLALYRIVTSLKREHLLHNIVLILLFVAVLIWPLSFFTLYTKENTRVMATNYILKTIPAGKSIGLEHWDDALPLYGREKYTSLTLPLYDPDTPEKWATLNETLLHTDYIILASNRLYVPLQKLTDCKKLPPGRCYQMTANYYRQLFTGGNVLQRDPRIAEFKPIAVFENDPTIPFLNIPIDDQQADESFTVYDHPKIIIFKKDAI